MIREHHALTIALAATLAIGAGAAVADAKPRLTGEAELADMLKDRVPGKPVDCIDLPMVSSSTVIDKTAIVYQMGGTYYVQRPRSGAESLDSDDVLVTRLTTSELCSIDTVQLHDRSSGFWRGFVSLDKFVPYTRPRKVAPSK
ncbi:hypothetical protein [Novosphingobium acidiphilum]|jgi:hypothetical protein|uniref:hypothetical protein n=1 Tax=Novosphingobium acidiphilum TaxID=505248 RepID=UPI0003F51A53|nr:hypothetical protein [Novosphingobium acidiphilum]